MLARYKEDFGRLMVEANLSDYEFVVLAKRLGLDDDKPMGTRTLAKMLNLSESLVKSINKRAVYKVKMTAEDQGEFEVLFEALTRQAQGVQ